MAAKKSNISVDTLKQLMDLGLDAIKAAADNMSKVLKFDPPIKTDYEVTGKGAAKVNQEKKYVRAICDELYDIVTDTQADENGLLLVNPEDVTKFDAETNDIIRLVAPDRVEALYGAGKKATAPTGKGATPFKPRKDVTERKELIYKMISEGKHTRQDIIAAVQAVFPNVTPASLSTFLTDCKNAKYNKYDKLAQEKNKVFSFVE